MISANVGLIKGFSFQHKHIISYLQITEANIYKLFIKQGCYLFLFFLRGNLIILRGEINAMTSGVGMSLRSRDVLFLGGLT